MTGAPKAYRDARAKVLADVKSLFKYTNYMRDITPAVIKQNPAIVSTLRQATAPPLASDRLMGLTGSRKSLMMTLESGKLPVRMSETELDKQLQKICAVVEKLLDKKLFSWLNTNNLPTHQQIEVAAVVVGDRRANVLADRSIS